MKRTLIPLLLALVLFPQSSCDKGNDGNQTDISKWNGLLINEIAANDQADAETWVEILNSGSAAIDLTGLGLYITDEYFKNQSIWQAAEGQKLEAGDRLVLSTADESLRTGISSAAQFVLKLGVKDTSLDEFDRDKTFAAPSYARGSYQRVPDGSETWKNLTYDSRGKENYIFDIKDFKSNAVWCWSSHIPDMMDNDAAKLKNMKKLGYDHILLNFAAFNPYNLNNTLPFLDKCDELEIQVHAWLQCFYQNGGWISPVDDDNKCYREDVYERIRSDARNYIENFGVKGLHLDYIRFGGTASKHNVSAEVNSIGAVNRCCRELRELCDSFGEGLVTSAALMPEPNTEYAYAQSPSQMGKYIHILMPMLYRYSYGWSNARCKELTNWFVNNGGGAEVWAGITTYTGNDSGGVTGMSAEAMRKDIDIFMDSKAKGLVLFRYGLGTFPDVNDINNN